jgi:hypothetical protein
VKAYYAWTTLKGGELIFDHGKQMLRGFHVMADVVDREGKGAWTVRQKTRK